MQRALCGFVVVASIGIAATIESEFWYIDKVGAGVARGLIAGVILGSTVWPYNSSLAPAHIHSRLLMWSAVCNYVPAQCSRFGLA
jgi:hypothetical protein